MLKRSVLLSVLIAALALATQAQKAEVTLSLNEAFFDALLGAIYDNFEAPAFTLGAAGPSSAGCEETIRILREIDGVRTAVRFRDGRINVPLAFSGDLAAPLVGCIPFSGWADADLDLEFDRAGQRLIGRVRVRGITLTGTGGAGRTLVARMLQRTIDRKLNPVEIIQLDKLTFAVPVNGKGSLRMRPRDVTTEIVGGSLNLRVAYDFVKA